MKVDGICRRPGCGEKILWLPNDSTGKVAPIDAEPVLYGGNIDLVADPETGEIVAYHVLRKDEERTGQYRQSHWLTCKNPPFKRRVTLVNAAPALSRSTVREVKCPACGADEGELCVGAKGLARHSNHQERVEARRKTKVDS